MNWNSFDLYTKLPATIDSSNQIARIGNLLTRFEGKTYDYRFLSDSSHVSCLFILRMENLMYNFTSALLKWRH